MEALRLEDIHQVRLHEGREMEILKGIDLSVPSGRISVVIGPSGGGKSTLIRLLNRLENPSRGRILLEGTDISHLDPLELRRRVGLVPQKPVMFQGTVLSNLQAPFIFRGESPPEAEDPRITAALSRCRLGPELLRREARSLSLGEQQRASLSRALVVGPKVLLMDEPTSALDRPTGDRLGDTLREIALEGGLTLLMVTHDLRLAERIADHIAFLENGRILESGGAREVLLRPRTQALRRFLAQPEEGEG